ncbi:DUF2169 domain-containing protein [Psychrosphaera sp. F3M07]|uniref:DUF2169 family type VI secretion system accessory protein n=1 Tax=Psychrosphaera sp. F3M07 TaxID=2841560 RepID=UPI001C091898|nr:DUF2169 domain-containing protein [Psychrosphaera sp. F3M07]MBU2918688.1 DUF2169 domain-containing protein [Psychrosphaera sp. F3M07]
MNIVKPLQLSVLHKSFTYLEKDIFAVSIPIAFSLIDGEILLEQKLWETIGEQLDGDVFDGAMPKQAGEVLVCGDFIAPNNQAVNAGSVHLKLSVKDKNDSYQVQVDKELAVFGDRHWYKLLGAGITPSSPKTFSEMPITYQNAYGGDGYSFNPVGKGFKAIDTDTGEVQFLPNVEYKNSLITSSSRQVQPASLGRVDIMWQPRVDKAGTYDQEYLDNQMPGLANDISWEYYNDAAEDQWLNGFFKGSEHYSITNMHAEHKKFEGVLPQVYGRAFVNQTSINVETNELETQFKEIPTKMDTLWLFPNAVMGVMIYRGTIEAHSDDGSDVSALLLACENRDDQPRTLKHYQDQLTKRLDPVHGYKYALFSSPLIANGMTCGFKQIQEEYDFPLEMLGKSNIDEFADNKRKEMSNQLDDAKLQIIEQCKAMGVDPTPYIDQINNPEKAPEQIKIEALMEKMAPGMVTAPNNIDIFNIDLSVMDEIKVFTDKLAEEKTAAAKEQIKLEVEKLKEDKDYHLFTDAIADMEKNLDEIDLPPMWPRPNINEQLVAVKKQVLDASTQIDEMRKLGVPEERLPTLNIDIESIEKQLLDADLKLKETYIMGAHLMGQSRSPHPGQEDILKQNFITKLKNGESLVNGDYACIDLAGQNLQGLDLSGCYLEGVNFTGCDLSEVNFTGAILAGSNLTDAKLHNTNCKGANIGATNLTRTDLFQCNFVNAQLGNAIFNETKLVNCVLDNMTFIDTGFIDTVFDNTSIKQCNFINPTFNKCTFISSDLTQANFIKPVFTNADFKGAILDGANFVEATINEANFTTAQMINSRFVGGCELNNCKFVGADVSKSCLRDNQINNSDFSNSLLDEADFSGSNLENSLFVGAKAIRTQFMKSNLKGADLTNFNLMEGSLYKAYVVDVCFDRANLYCVNFMDSTLGNNKYKGANLDQTILKDWRP